MTDNQTRPSARRAVFFGQANSVKCSSSSSSDKLGENAGPRVPTNPDKLMLFYSQMTSKGTLTSGCHGGSTLD